MNRRLLAACTAVLCALVAASASAQDTAVAPQTSLARPPSRAWVVVGGTSTSFLSDCSDCDEETAAYRHTSSLLANAGAPINPRTDIGAEFLLVRAHSSATDRIRVAFVMGSVQFRPWSGSGFFVKAGLGMAFVKNWIISPDIEDTGVRSKALALGLGAGWEWRVSRHFGVQILGAQHVAALGDLELARGTVENVMGNFWSVGAAIVVR